MGTKFIFMVCSQHQCRVCYGPFEASAFERGNAWQMILQLLKDGTRHALGADGSIQQNDQKDPSIQAKTFSPQAT